MSGDSDINKEKCIVIGHHSTLTTQAKWLCIENIYQKFHRPNFYDIGGTYNKNDVLDFWFMCKIERVGFNYLMHLFVCNSQELGSFNVAVSFRSDLQFDRPNSIAFLSESLKEYHYENMKERSYNYITTYNYTDFEIDLLKDKKLHIAISIPVGLKRSTIKQCADIQFKYDLGALLTDPVGSDFTVESQDGEKFKVHKLVLSAHSDVFKAMLKEDTAESQANCVKLTDVATNDLRSILEFLYTGTLNNIEQLNLVNILMLADQYNIKGLLELCQHGLSQQLTKENVLDSLSVADMYNADILKTSALKFIKTNATALHGSN